MKSPIILDRSVFPYQDIRHTGGGAKPKVKREVKMAPGFLKPKVPMPCGAVPEVNEGNVFVEEGGEAMDEGPDDVAPLAAGSRATLCSCEGILCSCGGYVCEAVGDDFVCPHQVDTNTNTERSVVAYTPPVNRGKISVSV